MRILITGGFGFIGGRLAQHLSNLGHEITLGSRKVKSPPSWLRDAKVALLDWNRPEALAAPCKNIDLVIHAAGMNAHDCSLDPIAAEKFNGGGTEALVLAAANSNVKRFIYLSTAHVYSNPLHGLIDENSPTKNQHPYALSHLQGEKAVENCSIDHSIEGVITRVSNVFGAPSHPSIPCWSLLTNDLCKQAIKQGEMLLITDGTQKRDFLDMHSACDMLSLLCEKTIAPNKSLIVNIGSGRSFTLIEMATLIQDRCRINFGFTPKITINNKNISEKNSDLIFNIERIQELGYSFKQNITNEVDNLLTFCKSHC
jgi:UDP-glucose 4-epimerase